MSPKSNIDQSYLLLSKKSKVSSCGEHKKCPCRMWVNCKLYVDIEEQQKRLKRKKYKNKTANDIKEWHHTRFRLDFSIHDLYCSG